MSNRPAVFRFLYALLFCAVVAQRFVDDSCTLEPLKVPGFCKRLNDCKEVFQELINNKSRIFPKICSFEGLLPIVCCPKQPGDISRIQCKKYSSYVNLVGKFGNVTITIPQCGQAKVQKLIYGGKSAAEKEFPHMALLGYESPDGEKSWNCGGSIISESYILTAAHCLFTQSGTVSVARVGITNLNDTKHRQEIKVEEVIPHPEYKPSSNYHDIGLIKLEKPINLDPYARPACLYSRMEVSGKKALATGWGFTSWDASAISDKLLKAKLSITKHENCSAIYKSYSDGRRLRMGIIDDMQICAGTASRDTCMGDSGGPLQIYHSGDDIKCMYDIIGVTSFGKLCPSAAGVYIRVSHYVQWIEDIVWP